MLAPRKVRRNSVDEHMSNDPPVNSQSPTPSQPVRHRRLKWLLIYGAVLTVCVVFYIYFWLLHLEGEGPAGPNVSREPFKSQWSERPVVLLGLGDSITAGYGASPGHSYFDMIEINSDDDFDEMQGLCLSAVLPNLTSHNASRSGSTSLEHADWHLPEIEPYPEDVFGIIVVSTGGNDIIHNYGKSPPREGAMYGATLEQAAPWIRNYEERLDGILDGLASKFPGGCHIFLLNIYDPTDGVGDIDHFGLPAWPDGIKIHAAYNEIIANACEERDDTTLIDIHSEFMGHGIRAKQFWQSYYDAVDTGYWYYPNIEDPNDRGYDAIRRLCLIEMARVLPELLSQPAR